MEMVIQVKASIIIHYFNVQKMKKILFISIIVISFYGIFFYKEFKRRCDFYYSSFRGKIVDLTYTEQSTVAFKFNMNDDWTYLGTQIKYDIAVEIGDSLIKKANDNYIFLIKNGIKYDITTGRKAEKYLKYCNCR